MQKLLSAVLISVVTLSALCQSPSSKYQPGTITEVKPHQAAAGADPSVTRYDISLRVGNTVYIVQYAPPPGTYGVQYSAGRQLLVLVGKKTITFNDILGNSRKVPILSRTTVSAQSSQ